MNTEQERADFEAWLEGSIYSDDSESFHADLWNAYQAGRAALQSHDSEVWLNRLISLAVSYGDSRHFEVEADDKRDAACRSAQAFKNLIDHARALQSQATEAFPCRIVEADFETGTVTLEMHGKYTVSSGQKYLCDAPLQSQDRGDVKRPVLDSIVDEIHRRADKEWADDGYDFEVTITTDEYKALCEEEKAIDNARRVEEKK